MSGSTHATDKTGFSLVDRYNARIQCKVRVSNGMAIIMHMEYLLDKEESEGFGEKEFGHRKGCKIYQFYIPIRIK